MRKRGRRCFEISTRPFVVEAAAGTGKTTVLVGRIVAVVKGWARTSGAGHRGHLH
jgi:ATP-dependent exoDNAse (exonuclease V) beta subunit